MHASVFHVGHCDRAPSMMASRVPPHSENRRRHTAQYPLHSGKLTHLQRAFTVSVAAMSVSAPLLALCSGGRQRQTRGLRTASSSARQHSAHVRTQVAQHIALVLNLLQRSPGHGLAQCIRRGYAVWATTPIGGRSLQSMPTTMACVLLLFVWFAIEIYTSDIHFLDVVQAPLPRGWCVRSVPTRCQIVAWPDGIRHRI